MSPGVRASVRRVRPTHYLHWPSQRLQPAAAWRHAVANQTTTYCLSVTTTTTTTRYFYPDFFERRAVRRPVARRHRSRHEPAGARGVNTGRDARIDGLSRHEHTATTILHAPPSPPRHANRNNVFSVIRHNWNSQENLRQENLCSDATPQRLLFILQSFFSQKDCDRHTIMCCRPLYEFNSLL